MQRRASIDGWGGEDVGSQRGRAESRVLQTLVKHRRAGASPSTSRCCVARVALRHSPTHHHTLSRTTPTLPASPNSRCRVAESLTRNGARANVWGAALGAPQQPRARPVVALVPAARPRVVTRRASISGPVPVAPVVSAPRAAPVSHAAAPPTLFVPGMTPSEIFSARAPVLTSRFLAELSQLAARVAEDAPQFLHSLRQISDMAQEVRLR
jgi:hypothetical protein